MMDRLAGRTALVTGGSRGIGAAIVRRLASEGAAVAFSYVGSKDRAADVVEAVAGGGGRAQAFEADQAEPGAAAGLVASAHAAFGRLDILVNSAGLSRMGRVDDPSPDLGAFERQFAVNVTGVAATVRAPRCRCWRRAGASSPSAACSAAPRPCRAGAITRPPRPPSRPIPAPTRAWARDLGPRGITVNALLPGPIDTDANPATSAHASTLAALGRYGTPDEVASAAAFLAGPDAAYVTGISLAIDGGMLA